MYMNNKIINMYTFGSRNTYVFPSWNLEGITYFVKKVHNTIMMVDVE